ncbi:diguanylate cyclase (GGDEF)-like protein [Lachnospiraceae bacterium PF1-21]|uniref:Diguanylate cyclase n=1 Tax=Ohessyouella blattaphilus TaxID=2949333 RepID=A0ABT1EDH3_9FIRM|nr:diguanylate cyclase [Ohessyouella blattaphilus]MCP1108757.1 diguanylate cyclase [Ohessyouella blattaphilus]MCR8562151.1 diguanylate cyclase [Ohessyouella blattaphilus]MDL2250530.1 diguanylate cyclase [Lachnospiraceae bacterium OttesenSCG-928-J05]
MDEQKQIAKLKNQIRDLQRRNQENEEQLSREIEKTKRQSRALQTYYELLSNLTTDNPEALIVLSEEERQTLLVNKAGEKLMRQERELLEYLKIETTELTITSEEGESFYIVKNFPIKWKDEEATAFVLIDISDNMRKQQELEQYAIFDMLTGTLSRYAGMDALHGWLAEGHEFVLSFVDIDNLKYVNDNFGHGEGDIYIIDVANLLRMMGEDFVISRIGGDEFMLLARDVKRSRVEEILAGVRGQMSTITEEFEKGYIGSISYGCVGSEEAANASELLSIADERMYTFKKTYKKLLIESKTKGE